MRNSRQHGASSGQLTVLVVGSLGVYPCPRVFLPRALGTSLGDNVIGEVSADYLHDKGSWGGVSSPLQFSDASASWKELCVCIGMSDVVRVTVT